MDRNKKDIIDEYINKFLAIKNEDNNLNINEFRKLAYLDDFLDFDIEQIMIILKGIRDNLDYEKYAQSRFTSDQLNLLYYALKKGFDIKYILDDRLSTEQMIVIVSSADCNVNTKIFYKYCFTKKIMFSNAQTIFNIINILEDN